MTPDDELADHVSATECADGDGVGVGVGEGTGVGLGLGPGFADCEDILQPATTRRAAPNRTAARPRMVANFLKTRLLVTSTPIKLGLCAPDKAGRRVKGSGE